jgi:phage terminase small subunit
MGRRPVFKTPEQKIKVEYPNRNGKGIYHTFNGHKISAKEEKFIRGVIEGKSNTQAYKDAGFKEKNAGVAANKLMKTQKIAEEIEYRLNKAKNENIATATEIMEYFTKVMRGEEKDQFGLDAPLAERTSAAKELMKRVVEMEDKAQSRATPEVKITLSFDRDGEEEE